MPGMGCFAVTLEHGPAWDGSRGLREQDEWDAHAAFMDALVADGFVVRGGPLDGGPPHVLLIVDASGEEAIGARLADDPWAGMGLLRIARVQPWTVLLRVPAAG